MKEEVDQEVYYGYQNKIVTYFSHTVSIIFTFVVLLAVLVLSVINQKVNISLPYRLSIFILIGDFLFSCSTLVIINSEEGTMCAISFLTQVFSTLISLLYTLSIGLNLYLTVVFKYQIGVILKYAYYIVPLILALTLSILPVALGEIILTSGEGSTCWFNEDETSGFVWAYAVNYGWILFSIIFCTFVFATVSFNLFYEKYKFNTSFDKKTVANVNKFVVIRLLMFPLIPIVCYIVLVFRLLFGKSFTFDQEFQTSIASSFFKGLQGFFNASLFLYNSLLYKEAEKAIAKVVRSSEKANV